MGTDARAKPGDAGLALNAIPRPNTRAWTRTSRLFGSQELSSQLQRRAAGPDVATDVGPPLRAACVVPSEADPSLWSVSLKTAHSKTSVLLSAAEWETLVSGADQISRALQRLETLGVETTPAATSSRPSSTDASQAAAACCVQLAPMRQAEISSFRGAPLLSVREFYEQNGQKLPGKKGLAMSLEQAEALLSFAPRLSAALQARETTEPLELSQKKRVAVSEFKGRVSVDLREYWEVREAFGVHALCLPAHARASLPLELLRLHFHSFLPSRSCRRMATWCRAKRASVFLPISGTSCAATFRDLSLLLKARDASLQASPTRKEQPGSTAAVG